MLRRPEKTTHNAPRLKTSMAALVSPAMTRISCRLSSRASISCEKPAWSRNLARASARLSVQVWKNLAKVAIGTVRVVEIGKMD